MLTKTEPPRVSTYMPFLLAMYNNSLLAILGNKKQLPYMAFQI